MISRVINSSRRVLKKIRPLSLLKFGIVSIVFIVLGAVTSFGVTAFAQTAAGYPVGTLEGSDGAWYCDSGFSLIFFRWNTGSSDDANWWECQG